jgi:ClpP class serine protease
MKIMDNIKGLALIADDFLSWLPNGDDIGDTEPTPLYDIVDNTANVYISGVLTTNLSYPGYAVSMVKLLNIQQSLNNNTSVTNINYHIDSPGGAATIIDVLGDQIKRSDKKTTSIITGMAASGAYWLASQTDRIIVTPLSQVGSIGAVTYIYQSNGRYGRVTKYTSKNAPKKAPEGKNKTEIAEIKHRLNQVETEFINAVASGRKVTPEHVAENYGQGGIFLGREAVEIGMVDYLAESLEDVEKMLKHGNTVPVNTAEPAPVNTAEPAPVNTAEPALVNTAEPAPVNTAEELRIAEIAAIEAPGFESQILEGIKDPEATALSVMQNIIKSKPVDFNQPLPHGGVIENCNTEKTPGESVWDNDPKIRAEFIEKSVFLAYYEQHKEDFE